MYPSEPYPHSEPALRPTITDVNGTPWEKRPDSRIKEALKHVKLDSYDAELCGRYLAHHDWTPFLSHLYSIAMKKEGEEKQRVEEAIDILVKARRDERIDDV